MMLPVQEIRAIAAVCKNWKRLYYSDIIWKVFLCTFLAHVFSNIFYHIDFIRSKFSS